MKTQKELSRFQKNLNYYTFYLFLMYVKGKGLKDYDKYGAFDNYYTFMMECKEKLSDLIDENDKDLLLNQEPYKSFFKNLNIQIYTKKEKNDLFKNNPSIRDIYLNYSNTISYSNLKFTRNMLFVLGGCFFFIDFFILMIIYFTNITVSNLLLLVTFFGAGIFLIFQGVLYLRVIGNKATSYMKFKILYDSSYCYRRINEAKDVLESIILHNTPILRLQENILYRQLVKVAPEMKAVLKVLIENDYCHYDGWNMIRTEKFNKQFFYLILFDRDIRKGELKNDNINEPFQKLFLLEKKPYEYKQYSGVSDAKWPDLKELILKELKKSAP